MLQINMKKNNFITIHIHILFFTSFLCNNIVACQENQQLVAYSAKKIFNTRAWGLTNNITQLPKTLVHPKEEKRRNLKRWAEIEVAMVEEAQYKQSFAKPLSALQPITQSTIRKKKAPVGIPDAKERENTLLHTVVKENDIESVETLLCYSSTAKQINEYGTFGFTPLSLACIYNSYESAKLLLELNYINPNYCSLDTSTPLHNAIEFGNIGIMSLLLAHEYIDPTRQSFQQNTPNNTLLHVACFKKNAVAVRLLLEYKPCYPNWYFVDPNEKNAQSLTPLYVAAMQDDVATATLLLNHKEINPNCRTKDGITPLHIAITNENIEIVRLLISHPRTIISVGALDFNGKNNTPLDLAYKTGNNAIIELLRQHGACRSSQLTIMYHGM